MLNLTAIKAKITALKCEIVSDSISPMRLGLILEEILEQLRVIYRGDLSVDIEDAISKAYTALDKAELALDLLQKAINMHLEAARVIIVDCGHFVKGRHYLFETLNPDTGHVETHDVWNHSCRYRCLVTGTTQEPRWDSTDWMLIEGNPDFTVEFEPVNTVFIISDIDLTLNIVAWMHNEDITDDIHNSDVVWSRYSEDADGNPRPASDNLWAQNHAGAGKSIHITTADIDYNGRIPKVVRFTATVTLRDGSDATAALTLTNLK